MATAGSFLGDQWRPLVCATLAIVSSILVAKLIGDEFHRRNQSSIDTQLHAVLGTADEAISNWAIRHKSMAEIWASDPKVRSEASRLWNAYDSGKEIANSEIQAPLREYFRSALGAGLIEGYFVVSPSNVNLASSRDVNIGNVNSNVGGYHTSRTGETFITPPTASEIPLQNENGLDVTGRATMFVGTPLAIGTSGQLKLLIRLNPLAGFSGILEQGRLGKTGEIYAFDRSGRLVTDSRFDDELRQVGLISKDQSAILNVEIRDPGVRLSGFNLTSSDKRYWPLTEMARGAVDNGAGCDLTGYRDYRGIPVVGAWTWNDDLDIGITAEMDVAEAYETFYMAQRVLAASMLIQIGLILAFTVIYIRRRREQLYKTERLENMVLRRTAELSVQTNKAEEFAQEAERANKAKSLFLANMSHEIRTPLNGVVGMATLLKESALPAKSREMADVIIQSADSLLTILNDILDLSKIEAERLDIEHIPFDLASEVESVERLWKNQLAKKRVEFVLSWPDGLETSLIGDPTRLRQILNNLLSNAAKFTRQGSVNLRIWQDRDKTGKITTGFEVKDTGIGMSEEAIENLFQEFTQADASTTRRFGGTGLGLTICKNLVTLMGGSIDVESSEGEGSTFRFTVTNQIDRLTTDEGSIDFSDLKISAKDALSARAARILVAEDNLVNQKVVESILETASVSAVFVKNGLEAVEAVCREPFDLVLMDIQMPIMDGIEAVGKIRALDSDVSNIPIIALTANAMQGVREEYLEAGMDGFVTKPFVPRSLFDAINDQFGGDDTAPLAEVGA